MTLDEAIRHCEEVAEEKEAQAWEAQLQEEYRTIKSCKGCAEEHRQLAEWLKELKQLREQEPCEDCISRKALLDKKWDVPFDGKYIQVVDVGDIEELPSVQLARPKGHWINIDKTHSKCDRCGAVFEIVSANYCPNCGCKMESREMN